MQVNPEKWIGKKAIVVYQLPNEEPVWHQGDFARGNMVGINNRFAFCSMIANGKPLWAGIPDEASIIALLPYPVQQYAVNILSGEYAGKVGYVTGTKPKQCELTVEVITSGKAISVDVPASDVELTGARRK